MEKAKYKYKDAPQSILSLYNDNRMKCPEWATHFIDLMQTFRPTHLANHIPIAYLVEWAWAGQDSKRIKWLLEKGYIDEVQSEYDKWLDEGRNGMTHSEKVEWAKRMPRD